MDKITDRKLKMANPEKEKKRKLKIEKNELKEWERKTKIEKYA